MSSGKAKMNKEWRTIQVTLEQYEACRAIQTEIENDPRHHGFTPTIHHIARTLLDKGLQYWHERDNVE